MSASWRARSIKHSSQVRSLVRESTTCPRRSDRGRHGPERLSTQRHGRAGFGFEGDGAVGLRRAGYPSAFFTLTPPRVSKVSRHLTDSVWLKRRQRFIMQRRDTSTEDLGARHRPRLPELGTLRDGTGQVGGPPRFRWVLYVGGDPDGCQALVSQKTRAEMGRFRHGEVGGKVGAQRMGKRFPLAGRQTVSVPSHPSFRLHRSWEAFRVMRPNTSHAAFTIKECVAGGGRFYSLDHLEETLVARFREHYYGPSTFNSVQPGAQNMIIRLARWLHRRLEDEEGFKGSISVSFAASSRSDKPFCRKAPLGRPGGSGLHAATTAPVGASSRKPSGRCGEGRKRKEALHVCQTFQGSGRAMGNGGQVRVPAPMSVSGRGAGESSASVGAQRRHERPHSVLYCAPSGPYGARRWRRPCTAFRS